jgi:hypothetical protein
LPLAPENRAEKHGIRIDLSRKSHSFMLEPRSEP